MKTIILILLLTATAFGQDLLLMDDEASTPSYSVETLAYIDRVETDGGTVINAAEVDLSYALGLDMDSVICWVSPAFGVKKDANDKCTKLYDLGNNDNDMAQADTSVAPTWYTDSLEFDGTNDYIKITFSGTQIQPNTIVMAMQNKEGTTNNFFWDGSEVGKRNALGVSTGNPSMYAGGSVDAGFTPALNTKYIISVDFNTTDSCWVNGAYSASGDAGATEATGATLMNQHNTGEAKKGSAYEFFFHTNVSDTMRESVETIMNTRWSIY